MDIGLIMVLMFFGAITCYVLDRSYFLFKRHYYDCLKERAGFRHGLRFFEFNQLLKNPAVSIEHKLKFRRYKRLRILGHLLMIAMFLSLIINGLFLDGGN